MRRGTVLAGAGVAVASGGAAGWMSSVYAAGPVARRQETARSCMEARQRLSDVITTCLGRLRIVHDERQLYPEGYADLASSARFAGGVLAVRARLPPRGRSRSRPGLPALVG